MMRRIADIVMPSSAIVATCWMMRISIRVYRRCPPADRCGETTCSSSTRRRKACFTASICATCPTV
jgi:hypothetical protein